MTYERWSREGQINIDADSPIAPYLRYLGSDCHPGVYAYKIKKKQGSTREFKMLIKRLSQFGSSDENHLIFDFNLKKHPPIQFWHFKDANEIYIGSSEHAMISIVLGALLKD